ncbi:MAG: glycosyltransferase family 4 protein, partial [Lachnospiraceae bacterium]|nr:glycosyltransferase family 4 protein [Lachnospiraceae bacterium]
MKKKILILANSASGLYDFRNELLLELLKENEVHVSLPDEQRCPELSDEGCIVHHTDIDRRGINPIKDIGLIRSYHRLMKEIKPEVVLTYTIKPNIYGGICCRFRKVPYITNITGLGSVFENGGIIQKIVVCLYRMALKKAACIFFQNQSNKQIFENFRIKGKSAQLVPGSGVNLDRHRFEEYPSIEEPVIFLYAGRIMKEKGIDELLYAAGRLKQQYPDVVFEIIGKYEDDYKSTIEEYEQKGIIRLVEYQKDMHPYYRSAWAVLMPSYHEGMSNVILEAAATGRPVIASDIPGCREGFEEGRTGFGAEAGNKESLYQALERFMELPYEKKAAMGQAAREKMKAEFDREKVVKAYLC